LQLLVNRILQRRDAAAPKVIVDQSTTGNAPTTTWSRAQPPTGAAGRRGASARSPRLSGAPSINISPATTIEAISEEGDEAGRKKMTIRVRQTPITAPGQTQ
jgi:hypothetical protein